MKTISLKSFILISAILVFAGCSNENESFERDVKNSTDFSEESMMRQESSQVTNYLTNFYNTTRSNITYGVDIETVDDNVTVVITEIIVGSDLRARGYVATEKNTGDFLYFVDVDRNNFVLTANDIVNNKQDVINDIDKNSDYLNYDEFDFIKVVNDANNNVIQRRKFWGKGKTTCREAYQGLDIATGTELCITLCQTPYYVFWMNVSPGEYIVGGAHPC